MQKKNTTTVFQYAIWLRLYGNGIELIHICLILQLAEFAFQAQY